MDNRRSVERVADVIRGCRADVVCLQEVHRRLPQSRMQDQPARLAELLKMRATFEPSYRIGVGGFGNAILTNLPIRKHDRFPLANHWERRSIVFLLERRALVSAVVETESGPVRIMTAHLSLNHFDRMKAVERVRELVSASTEPLVLCGDMNARPESEEMQFLASEGGLQDAGKLANEPTFCADRPDSRIDYVWHSSGLRSGSVLVVDTQASDHLPLVADLDQSVFHVK